MTRGKAKKVRQPNSHRHHDGLRRLQDDCADFVANAANANMPFKDAARELESAVQWFLTEPNALRFPKSQLYALQMAVSDVLDASHDWHPEFGAWLLNLAQAIRADYSAPRFRDREDFVRQRIDVEGHSLCWVPSDTIINGPASADAGEATQMDFWSKSPTPTPDKEVNEDAVHP